MSISPLFLYMYAPCMPSRGSILSKHPGMDTDYGDIFVHADLQWVINN